MNISSEIFGVAECEIISLRKLWNISRRLRLRSMWNEICPHSRQRIFHICGANISQQSYFTCPKGKFHWKKPSLTTWLFSTGAEGLEPTTPSFGDWCSTNWTIPLCTNHIISHKSPNCNTFFKKIRARCDFVHNNYLNTSVAIVYNDYISADGWRLRDQFDRGQNE